VPEDPAVSTIAESGVFVHVQPCAARSTLGTQSVDCDCSWTELRNVHPGQRPGLADDFSPRPATAPEEEAPDHSVAPLAARSPPAGTSTTATDPAVAALDKRDRARYGTAGTDPADTPRRPSPARRTARSIDGPPAPCEPGDACPAPTAPSPDRVSPPGPPAARIADTGTAHHRVAADSRLRPPYREDRLPPTPDGERQPDESPEAANHQRGGTRRGRRGTQPTANSARPRDGDSPPARAGRRACNPHACDHS